MQRQVCFQYGHNSRNCPNKDNPSPPSSQLPNQRRKRQRQTPNQIEIGGSSSSQIVAPTFDPRTIRRERNEARKGYGLSMSNDTNNIYLRMPGHTNVQLVHGPAQNANETRRGRPKVTRKSSTTTTTTQAAQLLSVPLLPQPSSAPESLQGTLSLTLERPPTYLLLP